MANGGCFRTGHFVLRLGQNWGSKLLPSVHIVVGRVSAGEPNVGGLWLAGCSCRPMALGSRNFKGVANAVFVESR